MFCISETVGGKTVMIYNRTLYVTHLSCYRGNYKLCSRFNFKQLSVSSLFIDSLLQFLSWVETHFEK